MLHLLGTVLVGNFDGQIQLGRADHDRATQLFTAALDAARSASDQFTILISLYDLALSDQAHGDLGGAVRPLREGLSPAAEAGIRPPRPTTWRRWPPSPGSTGIQAVQLGLDAGPP
jgi:hypothetical protein